MSRLPGTGDWADDEVDARLEFLENCARGAAALSRRFGAGAAAVEAAPAEMEAAASLGRLAVADLFASAAELAFCVDRVDVGQTLLLRAMETVRPVMRAMDTIRPGRDLPHLVRLALYGALLGNADVRVTREGLSVEHDAMRREFPWTSFTTIAEAASALPILVIAALATGAPGTHAELILQDSAADSRSRAAQLAAIASPEFSVLGLFGLARLQGSVSFALTRGGRDITAARSTLMVMEKDYEIRIELLQSDTFYWSMLRPRADLIDWSLLAVHVALLRRGHRDRAGAPAGSARRFVRDLAAELARYFQGGLRG